LLGAAACRGKAGAMLGVSADASVVHVYSFRGALIARMGVEDPEDRPAEH
jgi:hypothetical protein